jgi:hypothetical protein
VSWPYARIADLRSTARGVRTRATGLAGVGTAARVVQRDALLTQLLAAETDTPASPAEYSAVNLDELTGRGHLSIATHEANVYIDLSGWSPRCFPPRLVRAVNTMLRRKVLLGSDLPVLNPDRWMADFDTLEIKSEVGPLLLEDNAVRMVSLGA